MTASAEAPCNVRGHKHFCTRYTLLLSRGQIVCRGEEALAEFLRRRPSLEVTA